MTDTKPGDIVTIHVDTKKLYAAIAALLLMTGGNLYGTLDTLLSLTQQTAAVQVSVDQTQQSAEQAEANAEATLDLQLEAYLGDGVAERCAALGWTDPDTEGDDNGTKD